MGNDGTITLDGGQRRVTAFRRKDSKNSIRCINELEILVNVSKRYNYSLQVTICV